MAAIGIVGLAPKEPTNVIPDPAPACARWLGFLEILVALEAFKIRPHRFRAPGVIADKIGQVIPIRIRSADGDHRVVNRATSQGRRARIKDARSLGIFWDNMFFGIGGRTVGVRRWIGVMFYKELPAKVRMLGRETVERRNCTYFMRTGGGREVGGIRARLDNKNTLASHGGETGRERSTARA